MRITLATRDFQLFDAARHLTPMLAER